MGDIRIRNVPDDLHLLLKERAAAAGMTLSAYLLVEIRRFAALPTMEEMIERVRRRERFHFDESAAAILRRERDAS